MIDLQNKVKYQIRYTNNYKKNYKKLKKQGKDVNKLKNVISILANGEYLPEKYKDHSLYNDKNLKIAGIVILKQIGYLFINM